MNPKEWQRIKSIFDLAVDLDPAAKKAFLDGACGIDSPLRREVESLIAADDDAGSSLDEASSKVRDVLVVASKGGLAESALPNLGKTVIGQRLGDYHILSRLDQGGMGLVYLAARQDGDSRPRFAIKFLKPEKQHLLDRFLKERRILAELEHPNIARFIDGGTTKDGRPYFVMELIDGKPLDEFCDERRMSVAGRIRVFLKLCRAVQKIHESLIVHRDLKPSNVLVTPDGEPKLLDFGIAKLLNPDLSPHSITRNGARMLTPEFTSPEQIRCEPTAVATDVYSLGVVLYRLLTGHRPYRVVPLKLPSFLEAICAQEPTPLAKAIYVGEPMQGYDGSWVDLTPDRVSHDRSSTPPALENQLMGTLDEITLLALRKQPSERYGSVEELSTALSRYLETAPSA